MYPQFCIFEERGAISGQQLGQFMLEQIKTGGGKLIRGKLVGVEGIAPFRLQVDVSGETMQVSADRVVNAAGPFLKDVGTMIGEELPVSCVYQQKISFEDRERALPRNMPFTIDLDGQSLNWSDEERAVLMEDIASAKLALPMPGAIHCRPDGAEDGRWIKLGWAYNDTPSDPHQAAPIDSQFPDIVLRGASRLNPGLSCLHRKATAGRPSLWWLLHHDRRELAADRSRWKLRWRFHCGRIVRLRNDGGLCDGRALRRLRRWSAIAGLCRVAQHGTVSESRADVLDYGVKKRSPIKWPGEK